MMHFKNNDPHRYDDIVYLDRPKSARKKMSISDRSAQFAPFAALTGHSDAILETERITDEKIILSEETMEFISTQLNWIDSILPNLIEVKITYFMKDEKKQGGRYCTKIGNIKKIDTYNHKVILNDNTSIPITDIISIDSDFFSNFNL